MNNRKGIFSFKSFFIMILFIAQVGSFYFGLTQDNKEIDYKKTTAIKKIEKMQRVDKEYELNGETREKSVYECEYTLTWDINGEEFEVEGTGESATGNKAEEYEVTIFYNPENPEDYVEQYKQKTAPGYWFCIGLGVILIVCNFTMKEQEETMI